MSQIPAQPKLPAPVADDIAQEHLHTLIERTGKLALAAERLLESQESMRKSLARDVAKGVFFGVLAVAVLAFVAGLLLGVIQSG
jgi:hypothetical protein